MYNKPRAAKKLYFDVIPKTVDDYLTFVEKFPGEQPAKQLENPVWHIHDGQQPDTASPVSFALLLNLASAANTEEAAVMWGFIERYNPGITPDSSPMLARLVDYALVYYRDFVKPNKSYRAMSEVERAAFEDLETVLEGLPADSSAEDIQNQVYEVGKRHPFETLRDWFKALYEVLLGQEQGPRMGSFIALYGRENFLALLRRALAGEDLSA
jgi:lysyl-tRNA synthetase class 1